MAAGRTHRLLDQGARAPEVRLERLEGGETTLKELSAGGPLLLVFFKVTCPVCQLALPFLERIHAGGRLPVFAVSQNTPEDTRDFNRYFHISIPTLLDREEAGFPASNAFGISSVPTLFLVERGKVSRVAEGWQKREIEHLGALAGVNPFRPEDKNVPQWKAG